MIYFVGFFSLSVGSYYILCTVCLAYNHLRDIEQRRIQAIENRDKEIRYFKQQEEELKIKKQQVEATKQMAQAMADHHHDD